MAEGFDPEAWRQWSPAAQERALEALAERSASKPWRPFFCPKAGCDGLPHDDWTWNHARADQHPPTGDDWLTWALISGRGSGKTRVGAEYLSRLTKRYPRVALVGATGPDAREVMIEGESGIVTIAEPSHRPHYEPSKRRLTWPNGAKGAVFSAEEPDRLRGPEHYAVWCDEPAHWPLVQECWDNLLFGLRLGPHPRVIVTSTPKPRPWLKALIAEPDTVKVTASTYANLANLAPVFANRIIKRYEGTRLGRQELHGEILEDVEGALWSWALIEASRTVSHPELTRIVIGIDPAGSKRASADETGIVAVGRDATGDVYVLADRSGRYSPLGWATMAHRLYDELNADAIVAEVNFGADMVASNIRSAGYSDRLITVRARKGKDVRAEPVVSLWEQGRAHIVGSHPELEESMTSWVPYSGDDSPDRLDAMVYAALIVGERPGRVEIASPVDLHIDTAGYGRHALN